jgi:NAD+ synthase
MNALENLSFTIAQINPVVGDIQDNCGRIADIIKSNLSSDIIIFPELVTCGYPPEDLVLRPSFMDNVEAAIQNLRRECAAHTGLSLISSPWRIEGKLYNAVLVISEGQIKQIIPKVHLPNYGVFDEIRIFERGKMPIPIEFKGVKLGILTCEDLWFSDIAEHLKAQGAEVLISPNGSPYDIQKHDRRIEKTRVHNMPLIYVNQVGGQDELVFDGGSFVLDRQGQILHQASYFKEDISSFSFAQAAPNALAQRDHLNDIYEALCLGLGDYIRKNGFKGILLGLSGGIDSALAAVIAADAIGAENVHCVMLPTQYTSQISLDDAAALAKNLGCSYEIINIEDTVGAIGDMIGAPAQAGIAAENIQSRLRGLTLMALSNAGGQMVLSTGNKSEMAVGYATLYGDMCGGFNALKDVYKTQVFALSRHVNEKAGYDRIPERIITRPPSAELRADQTDQDSLPEYDILDAVLEGIIEQELSLQDLVNQGFEKDVIMRVWGLLDRAEYKRRQAPPGVKITTNAFGKERRYPITNKYREE